MEPWAALRGDGTFSLHVVGVASCQIELRDICGGDREGGQEQIAWALLIPEADNPYGAEAVRVQVWQRTVGYLSGPDARAFRACLDREPPGRRYRCRAKIQRTSRDGMRGQWGVWLDACLPAEAYQTRRGGTRQHPGRVRARLLASPFFLGKNRV